MSHVANIYFIAGVLVAVIILAGIGELICNYQYWQRTKDLEKRVKELESRKDD